MLLRAALNGYKDIIGAFLEYGVQVNFQTSVSDYTIGLINCYVKCPALFLICQMLACVVARYVVSRSVR